MAFPPPLPLLSTQAFLYQDLRTACAEKDAEATNSFTKTVALVSSIAALAIRLYTGSLLFAGIAFFVAASVALSLKNHFLSHEYQEISDELAKPGFQRFLDLEQKLKPGESVTIDTIADLFSRYTHSVGGE